MDIFDDALMCDDILECEINYIDDIFNLESFL